MRCVRCGRKLDKPAATIARRGNPLWVGPKCAAVMFPKRTRPIAAAVQGEIDPRQMALQLESL